MTNFDAEIIEVLQLIPDLVYRWEVGDGGEWSLQYQEGRMAKLFGGNTEVMAGRGIAEVSAILSTDEFLPRLQLAVQGTPQEFVLNREGRTFRISLQQGSKNKLSVIGLVREITDLMEAEKAVRNLNGEIMTRLVELNQANELLRQSNLELERANNDLDAFAYTASHDLRTPLTVIENLVHVLLVKYGDGMDDKGRDHLKKIHKSTRRMASLISDLLRFSRASRNPIQATTLSLSSIVSEVSESLQAQEPDRDVKWTIEPGVMIHADEGLIRVVIENLLGNAWKYSAKQEAAAISFYRVQRPEGVAYAVQDNGIGFSEAEATQIFEVFKRLDSAQGFEGSGIGLATVRRIIERHRGHAWAEGKPGEGATFLFTVRT